MLCIPEGAASRRYLYRFAPTMGLYLIFLYISVRSFRHLHPTGAFAYGLAVLPALPLIATLVIVGIYIVEEQDEFQRNLFVQSVLWGIGLSMAVMTVWGFLELLAGIPHFQTYLAYPLFWMFVGIATPLLKLRYR
jgi:hypothetical protein